MDEQEMEEEREPLPLAVAIYVQSGNDPRLPLRGGGQTQIGKHYLVARVEEAGPIIAWRGPFRSSREAEQSLIATKVQPPSEASGTSSDSLSPVPEETASCFPGTKDNSQEEQSTCHTTDPRTLNWTGSYAALARRRAGKARWNLGSSLPPLD